MSTAKAIAPASKLAEVELVYKSKVKASERPQITSSRDAYEVLLQTWHDGKLDFVEEFKILLLNRANRVICFYSLSSGGITGTVADPRLVLCAAIKTNSVAVILSHNHPSGNLKPSRADEELTTKIKEACRLVDIKVLDHIILTSESYFSFADEGLI